MVMTLGLIADIHADLRALVAALNLLDARGVDTILCAGDLVEKGADGDAVVALLQTRAIPCVQGNHDDCALSNQRWLREYGDPSHPNMRGRLLLPATLAFLGALPPLLRFTWEGCRVLLVHGTPQRNDEYLFPTTPAARYQQIARAALADVIIFGHTHTPFEAMVEGVGFFNPGAVGGGGPDARRTCATLRLPDLQFRVYELDS